MDEVYHPFVDQANTRDFSLLVTEGKEFFSVEKRATMHEIEPLAPSAPATG